MKIRLFLKVAVFFLALATTLILNIYHLGVARKPKVNEAEQAHATWYPKEKLGINHLVLEGPPFARGREAAKLVQPLLLQQENELVAKLNQIFPSRFLLQPLILGAILWFQDVEKYIEPQYIEEMYGTSLFAPKQYDYLTDGFTRQIAYHGLHEVGQMMVDSGFEDMGCTVVALPKDDNWILGRNFDFEGGRIFDSEKIAKWTFPDDGHHYAFLSIIWAGMVGAVTGVNEHGLYVSINAAGSEDFRRVATPSTLVLNKVLQSAKTAQEAVIIFKNAEMFITDIFVVLDKQGNLYRIEKSPKRFSAEKLTKPTVITNHLTSPEFENDKTNVYRKRELTTLARFERGQSLIDQIPKTATHDQAIKDVLAIMRDKGINEKGEPLHLGHRKAIDALIATHAVIYDPKEQSIYISEGPALAGKFFGYNLKESFALKKPVPTQDLPRDPQVSNEAFEAVKQASHTISEAHHLIKIKRCQEGQDTLTKVPETLREQSSYYQTLGDAQACQGDKASAKSSWEKALSLNPAYVRQEDQLKKRLSHF